MTPEWDLRGTDAPNAVEFDDAADSGDNGVDGTDARCGFIVGDIAPTRAQWVDQAITDKMDHQACPVEMEGH